MKINDDVKDDNEENKQDDYSYLKNVYDEEIYEVINQLKEECKTANEYISQTTQEFSRLNESFIEEIITHLKNKATLYEGLFNLKNADTQKASSIDIKIFTKKTIKSLKSLLKLHSQILETLLQHFQIFLNFLNISKYLNVQNPLYSFFSNKLEEIINSWLFMKLDLGNFDFTGALKNCNFEPNFKKLLFDASKSKLFYLNLNFPENEADDEINTKKNIEMISENLQNLTELNVENLKNYDKISKKRFKLQKLKKFSIKNVGSTNNLTFEQMPNLEKFKMKFCRKINVSLLNPLPEHLRKIYLEKNNFIDKDFYNILDNILLPNKTLLKNLEILSFAKNNLSKIDLTYINTKYVFCSLRELNFSKNKIYIFRFNKNNFDKLDYINCCFNNLNKSYLGDIPSILGLESVNLFLLNNTLFDKYYSQLKEKLNTDKIKYNKINYINISYLPQAKSVKYFSDFFLNESLILNLKKLDLSYNGLKCDTFFKFVKNNKGLFNLSCLNLTGNLFDDTFFEKYLEYDDIFNKLEHLNLNSNYIGEQSIKINYKDEQPVNDTLLGNKNLVYKLRLIYKFIEKNTFLKKLSLTENPISRMYLIKSELSICNNEIEDYIKVDENNNIIINCFISLLYKIKGELIQKSNNKIVQRNNLDIIFIREK